MSTVPATEARKRLYALIDEVGQFHEPVKIAAKRGNAILLTEEVDWRPGGSRSLAPGLNALMLPVVVCHGVLVDHGSEISPYPIAR